MKQPRTNTSDAPLSLDAACLEGLLQTMAGIRGEAATRIARRVAAEPALQGTRFGREWASPADGAGIEQTVYEDLVRPIVSGTGSAALKRVGEAFGWRNGGDGFSEIDPDFWAVLNLWPPRDFALAVTLADLNLPALEQKTDAANPLPVLDIGCGFGLLEMVLREFGLSFPLFGIDVSAGWLARARKAAIPGFEVSHTDAAQLGVEERFAGAFAAFVHHHVQDLPASLSRLCRALTPCSRFSFTDISGVSCPHGGVQPIDPGVGRMSLRVKAGIEVQVHRTPSSEVPHVKAHPDGIQEFVRPVEENIQQLVAAGFEIEHACWLDRKTLHVLCRKPDQAPRARP